MTKRSFGEMQSEAGLGTEGDKPVAVRFSWNQIAEPNLKNEADLPASPFRTDTWTDAVNVQ